MTAQERSTVDADLHLLDRQILDVDGAPVVAVGDIELTDIPKGQIPLGTPAPQITALLSGAALATRIFGGRPPARLLHRIEWKHLAKIGAALELSVSGKDLVATWTERWVRDRIISRIPGGTHDPQ